MIDRTERALTDEEREQLSARLAGARGESGHALVKAGAAGALVCGALAILTLLASDAPPAVILGFWSVLWLGFTLWIGLPWRKLMRDQVRFLEEAIRTARAREIRVQSERVVEFEEEEDEGACYAFDVGDGTAVFIVGQEFYESEEFPNSDFSMVEILGEQGQAVDILTVARGRKLDPERIISARVKNNLEIPEHLAIVRAPLDTIEASLPRYQGE